MVATKIHLLLFTINLSLVIGGFFDEVRYSMENGRHVIDTGKRQPGDIELYSDTPVEIGQSSPPIQKGKEYCYPPKGVNDPIKITEYEVKDLDPASIGGLAFDVSGGVGHSHVCVLLKTLNGGSYHYRIDVYGFRENNRGMGTDNYLGTGLGSFSGMRTNSYGGSGSYGGGNAYGTAAGGYGSGGNAGVWQGLPYGGGNAGLGQGPPYGNGNTGVWQGNPYGSGNTGLVQGPPYSSGNNGVWQGSLNGNSNTGVWQGPPYGNGNTGLGQGPPYGSGNTGAWQGPPYGSGNTGLGQGPPYGSGNVNYNAANNRGPYDYGEHPRENSG